MREVPECLNRRYQALDEMIKELSTTLPQQGNMKSSSNENTNDPGLRLMCDFWNILKEDPDCDLSQQVQQRMGLASHSSYVFRPQQVTCYMAGRGTRNEECDRTDRRKETTNKSKSSCCGGSEPEPKAVDPKSKCCASKSISPSLGSDVLPLSKVLCNLKDAASFDKKCNARINDLMATQKELKDQIQHLEHREQEGVKALKQADCMWSCMEDAYKAKIAESLERQKNLLKQLKEVEASTNKWRKNKKDLESQLGNINKCQQEITEKIHQKTNDIKCMDMEIADFKKRIDNNKKEMDAAKKSLSNRKQASDLKMANIANEMTKLKKIVSEENNHKHAKEQEGKQYVKEAREDLQKICRVLLQKKLENEDLLAEKDALLEEINLLKQICDQCKDKCKNKQQTINDEILKLEKEIAEYKVKCIRCHQCTDTVDVRKFCTDCPKCMEERDCLYEDDHCNPDHTMDCVCMSVKQKFLDNVFENMYTVLERQTNAGPGKAVAEAVLQCLKRSRNGKLNDETRKILQDFILSTIKKNLNLTIVGGAVKTRCEMDPETYKQLMLCLNKVKVSRPPKEDKGTAAKKESCRRWGGSSECNCPKGPKACVCTKKAPPPPQDPTPCPPPDKEDAGAAVSCPHKDSTACGPDCAMHAVPSCVGADVAQWRPDPCQEQSCVFSKNMRAAQCVLGPESLSSLPKSFTMPPYIPDIPVLENLITCKCGNAPMKPCTCREDRRSGPRERIIEEVMGRYVEVSPIDKVSASDQPSYSKLQSSKNEDKDDFNQSRISKKDYVICSRSSNSTLSKKTKQLKASKIKYCDKDTCANIWENKIYNGNEILPIVENEAIIDKETCAEYDIDIGKKPKTNSSVQLNILPETLVEIENEKLRNETNFIYDENIVEIEPKVQFKIKIGKEIVQLSNGYVELKNSASGTLTMELDENIIDLIEMKMKDPKKFAYLHKSISGHLILNFDRMRPNENDVSNVSVKKTPSGSRLLKVNKDFVKTLMNGPKSSVDDENILQTSSDRLCKTQDKITVHKDPINASGHKVKYFTMKNELDSNKNLAAELVDLYKKYSNKAITLTIQEQNRSKKVMSSLIRTSSGHIALNIKDTVSISVLNNEQSVLLEKTSSGELKLDLDSTGKSNAIIKHTSCSNILIVLLYLVAKPMEDTPSLNEPTKLKKFVTVRINAGKNTVVNPPVVLKATPSHNYLLVVDKEYEKLFMKNIFYQIDANSGVYVALSVRPSDTFIIHFDKNDNLHCHVNAFLIRTPSENIKVLVKGPIYDTLKQRKASSLSASKVFGDLIKRLPVSSTEIHKANLRKSKIITAKSSSDSQLYNKIKHILQDQKDLISKPPAKLRRTNSGNHAITLNKESKKAFVNNLKSYVSNSQGVVPIKRSASGEITIDLDEVSKVKGHSGSLKITSSGNIFITVDETVIKDMKAYNSNMSMSTVDTKSKHIIDFIRNPINKAVATTCHAKPDGCLCDPSQCICEDLTEMKYDFIDRTDTNNGLKIYNKEDIYGSCLNNIYFSTSKETNFVNNVESKNDMTPHIVIKSCDDRLLLEHNLKSTEQCFYVTESVCPYHKDRCKTVSNEQFMISDLVNKAQEEKMWSNNGVDEKCNDNLNWNSLDYLPPQLPPFLRDFCYH